MKQAFYISAIWPITAKLRQNWRREAAHLPIPQKAAAFTLIELSIVLVIIGLIVGGILVGQDLIETAKRQQIVSEWQELSAQVNTFKLKYNCLPGDCKNANQFFAGNSAGNGDKKIWAFSDSFSQNGNSERCQFWYHLSEANLTNEEFVLCPIAVSVHDHTPKLPFNDRTSYIVTAECVASNCNNTDGAKGDGHWIWTQGVYNNTPGPYIRASGSVHVSESPFTPYDLKWLDTKADNGNGLTGNMTVMINNGQLPADSATSCGDTAAADGFNLDATYGTKNRICHLRYKTAF